MRGQVIPRLGTLLAWDAEQSARVVDLVKAAHGPQRYQQIVVQVDLTRDDFDLLNAHQYQLPGVDLEPVPHRHYRAGAALAHVLGYMNEVTSEELADLNHGTDGRGRPTPWATTRGGAGWSCTSSRRCAGKMGGSSRSSTRAAS